MTIGWLAQPDLNAGMASTPMGQGVTTSDQTRSAPGKRYDHPMTDSQAREVVLDREGLADTRRLEAFSDAVFAVAITLLALDLPAPQALHSGRGLWSSILVQWPSFLAYGLSFLTILMLWINHHKLFRFVRRTDHTLLLLNGGLLMTITAVPFTTRLLAADLTGPDGRSAMTVYSVIALLNSCSFNLMLRHIVSGKPLLVLPGDRERLRSELGRYGLALVIVSGAVVLSFFSVPLSLLASASLVVVAAWPSRVDRVRRSPFPAQP